jgi:deoxycytidylate deaminase
MILDQELQSDEFPELVFGLIAPIGVKLDQVIHAINETLDGVGYKAENLRITDLMQEIKLEFALDAKAAIDSYKQRIAYANELCRLFGSDVLARLPISAIRTLRLTYWKKEEPTQTENFSDIELQAYEDRLSEKPIPKRAYIIRQLKRPEEIQLLRKVYGKQFIAVSTYSSEEKRIQNLQDNQSKTLGGLVDPAEAYSDAYKLVSQDAKEDGELPGQNVRDAFPLGDVFIDGESKSTCGETIKRFIHLLFGNNQITPTREEYGMYLAKSASLRSSDLSRQVGAAIFSEGGEVATLGCNEVPKAGGGTYWPSDPEDQRDFKKGADPNDEQKKEILIDIVNRLLKSNSLSPNLQSIGDPLEVSKLLLDDNSQLGIKNSRLMDLIEFGRIIHAEMSAISDAARKGISIKSSNLYCTTFPCHICAKHIVAAGVKKVIYLEPYPKSYASKLHKDSIHLGTDGPKNKVAFVPFIGVSPFRYRDLFEKGKRKYLGQAQEWNFGKRRPQIDVYFPSYFRSEALVVQQFKRILKELIEAGKLNP